MKTFAKTVGGRAVGSARKLESKNPATGEVLGLVPRSSAEQVRQAVAAAKAEPAPLV